MAVAERGQTSRASSIIEGEMLFFQMAEKFVAPRKMGEHLAANIRAMKALRLFCGR